MHTTVGFASYIKIWTAMRFVDIDDLNVNASTA